MDSSLKRKLSAIVFTDIVGFTELSAKNEPAALDLLIKQRQLLKPIVEGHEGVWLKEIGDGLLLTFNTSIEAVKCCVEIQKVAKGTPDLNLRIAIHQGEVVLQGDDIIGDDVNITSRIEKYASSGGIAISGRVNASLERDPEFSTKYLGSPDLKGVSQEVKIYSVISHGLPESAPIIEHTPVKKQKMNWNIFSITGAVLSVLGILFWINVSFLSKGVASSNKIPSVVILPFENKGDIKEDYYAYGISSDIISDITGIGQLRVASLISIEELQKEGLKNNEIAKKLSSRYVVSGSLWKIDSIFQLSMELFDVEEKKLLTSQRWEMNWKDLSVLKKDLSKKIIKGLNIKIINELDDDNSIDPVAYELYLQAKHTFKNRLSTQDNDIAMELIKKALSIDPYFLDAKIFQGSMHYGDDNDKALAILEEANELALKIKDNQAIIEIKYWIGWIFLDRRELGKSLKLYRESYQIAKKIGNKSSIAKSMASLGDYFYEILNYDSTRFYWAGSLELYESLDDKEGIANGLRKMALIYWNNSELDKAIETFEKSYDLLGWMSNITQIGYIYNQKGEFVKSLEYYDRALEHYVAVDEKRQIAYIHNLYGHHYNNISDYENAIESYKTSYDLYSELKIERQKKDALIGLISAYRGIGDEKNFQKYYAKSSEINTNLASEFYLTLGWKLLTKDDRKFARDCFFKQLEIETEKLSLRALNQPVLSISNTMTNIGLSYFYENDFENALKYFTSSIEHTGIENIYNTLETLTYKHLCEKELGIPMNDEFLRQYISKKENNNKNWFKDEPEYMNWAIYKYFGEDKYINEAKRQLDLVLAKIKPENAEKVSSYSMYRVILESYNRIQNL